MKTYVIMYRNRKEAEACQRENWMALDRMGIATKNDFLNSSINISDEIKLLHLTSNNWERLFGIEIEGWRTHGTFAWTKGNQHVLTRLRLCERR